MAACSRRSIVASTVSRSMDHWSQIHIASFACMCIDHMDPFLSFFARMWEYRVLGHVRKMLSSRSANLSSKKISK